MALFLVVLVPVAATASVASLEEVVAGKRGLVIDGDRAFYGIGASVASAGDINGDGLDDILIGEQPDRISLQPSEEIPGPHYGTAYVVFGRTDTARVNLADVRAGIGGFTIHAALFNDKLGDVVQGAGDVNGDGLADILVASYAADPLGRTNAGSVYVIFGKADTDPVLITDIILGNGGFAIHGAENNERLGIAFGGAGDTNADGFDDLILRATTKTYLVFGRSNPATMDMATFSDSPYGYVIEGTGDSATIPQYSPEVALGDINNDGKGDFLISGPLSATAAIIHGKTDTDELDFNDAGDRASLIECDTSHAGIVAVANAGDMNNDGRNDVVVSTTRFNAYVLFTSNIGSTVNLNTTTIAGAAGFVVRNEIVSPQFNGFGISMAGIGDQNNDGWDDLLIGAPLLTNPRESTGHAYVVYGKSTSTMVPFENLIAGTAGYELPGLSRGDETGFSTSSGDINGDGSTDLIVGAPGANPSGNTGAGAVFVVFGASPAYSDDDSDGISNSAETGTDLLERSWNTGTDPTIADSDGDWVIDGVELAGLSDPNNPFVTPRHRPHDIRVGEIASGHRGYVINGVAPNDSAGMVSGAGDVNGDGLVDVIVGAPGSNASNLTDAGNAYVVFGKLDHSPLNLSTIGAGRGFAIRGVNTRDHVGTWVAGLGDVNGDGLADVAVNAVGSDLGSAPDTGACFVVFGKASSSPVSVAQIAAGQGGFIIRGGTQYSLQGRAAAAGDVNGDGLADLAIGRTHFGGGQTLVVFGRASTAAVELDAIATGVGGFAVVGGTEDGGPGGSVSGAGDVNNDGLADIVIGLNGSIDIAGPGGALVVFGRTQTTPIQADDIRAGIGGFAVLDVPLYRNLGYSVSGAGDVNADGFDDVVIGAGLKSQDHARYAGACYVVFGKQNTTNLTAEDIEDGIGGFVIRGVASMDGIGDYPPAAAGDVNNDGFDDIVVGTTFYNPESPGGRAYVVFGKSETNPVSLFGVQHGTGGLYVHGADALDGLGTSVSGIGDLNSDGFDDLILGAQGDYQSGKPGRSFILFGFAPTPCDSDGDLIPDYLENNSGIYNGPGNSGTNPYDADSDDDGIPDGVETDLGTDPTDPVDFPDGLPLAGVHLTFLALVVAGLLTILGIGQARRENR